MACPLACLPRRLGMVVEDVDGHRGVHTQWPEWSQALGLLGIHENEACDLLQIEVFEPCQAQIIDRKETADGFLGTSWEHQHRPRIQFSCRHHRGKAVEVRMEMRRNDVHKSAGSHTNDAAQHVWLL